MISLSLASEIAHHHPYFVNGSVLIAKVNSCMAVRTHWSKIIDGINLVPPADQADGNQVVNMNPPGPAVIVSPSRRREKDKYEGCR
jgi:hypothetical protein